MIVAPKPPADVVQRGLDVTGRKAWASDYWWNLWEQMLWNLPWGGRLGLFQSAWQMLNGGGPAVSAGYHNGAGAGDGYLAELTADEVAGTVHYLRFVTGAPAWERGPGLPGNFADHHIHWDWLHDPGWRYPGLDVQLADYRAGGNGLSGSSHGPDYHPRPDPLQLTPTREALMGMQDDVKAIIEDAIDARVGEAVWGTELGVMGSDPAKSLRAGAMLRQVHYRLDIGRLAARISAKLADELPGGVDGAVVQQAVEAGVREVLGSLDD